MLIQDKLAAHDLLARVRRQGVNAGQVGNARLGVVADGAVLAVDRYAGKVTDVLVGARKLIEQGGLAAVLVTGKGKMQRRASGTAVLAARGEYVPSPRAG